jgi:protease-4
MFSTIEDFSPTTEQRFQAFLDMVYAGFKEHVASGRRLDKDTVEQIARGRVWSGEDAKARGLVDELGGYDEALRFAKLAAHLNADAPITLKQYPPEKDVRHQLLAKLFGREGEDEAQVSTGGIVEELTVLVRAARPALRAIEAMTAPRGMVVMSPIDEPR